MSPAPLNRRPCGRQQFPHSHERGSPAKRLGEGQDEQRGGVDTAVVSHPGLQAEHPHFADAKLVQYRSRRFERGGVMLATLMPGQQFQRVHRPQGVRDHRQQRCAQGVASEHGEEVRGARGHKAPSGSRFGNSQRLEVPGCVVKCSLGPMARALNLSGRSATDRQCSEIESPAELCRLARSDTYFG